jgi:hypothetical protein
MRQSKTNPLFICLKVRDSPLRDLHDPKLPYLAVHDWYISISLNYIEASMYILSKAFDSDYRVRQEKAKELICI